MRKVVEAIGCLVIILAVLTVFFTSQSYEVCFDEFFLMGYTVVLDAGHGGEDGGAIGISTLTRERDINLQIVYKIKNLLESAGASVVLTRYDEKALCKNEFVKMEDMRNRAAVIEENDPFIVISVHCNSFPQDKSVSGAQMFYFPGSESGKALAESIQHSLKEYIDNNNNRVPKEENFFMLRHGNSVSVMIECGFLSTPEEEKLLITESYQDKIAYAVFDGTIKYVSSTVFPQM